MKIRLHYSTDLPLLAEVGGNGRNIAIIVNPDLQSTLTTMAKARLFNDLMREFERHPVSTRWDRRKQASAVIIDLEQALARRQHPAAVGCGNRGVSK